MRRFWVSLALTAPLFLLAMSRMLFAEHFAAWVSGQTLGYVEFALATPVVLVGRLAVFCADVAIPCESFPNMFTLIGIGTGTAYSTA